MRIKRNPVAAVLRTQRPQVVKQRKGKGAFTRKIKHKGKVDKDA